MSGCMVARNFLVQLYSCPWQIGTCAPLWDWCLQYMGYGTTSSHTPITPHTWYSHWKPIKVYKCNTNVSRAVVTFTAYHCYMASSSLWWEFLGGFVTQQLTNIVKDDDGDGGGRMLPVRGVSVQTKTLESLVPGVDTGQCRDHVQCPVSHWHQPLPDCVQHNVLHIGVSESLPDANLDIMNHDIILASIEVVRMRQQSLTPPPNPWCFHYACYPPPPLLLAMNWISNWMLSVHFLSKSKL